jgi:Domain of unknown function (DUF4136)
MTNDCIRPARFMPLLVALLLAGCAGGPAPVAVTRFHLSQPLAGETIQLVAPEGVDAGSLDYQAQASAVAAELAKAGFRPVAAGQPAALTGVLRLETSSREEQRASPFSIGFGGMTGGRNVGVGGGLSLPVGRSRTRIVTLATLALQIRRASDGSTVWEGRASDTAASPQTGSAVPRLARALLANFPGPSGQTVTVKPNAP